MLKKKTPKINGEWRTLCLYVSLCPFCFYFLDQNIQYRYNTNFIDLLKDIINQKTKQLKLINKQI